jgi:hypothetical protein
MKSSWPVLCGLLLSACLVCEGAAAVRLQVDLSNTSVRVNSTFNAKITLVDAHAAPVSASGACRISVDILDSQTQKPIEPGIVPVIAAGQASVNANLLIRKAGFYGVRAATACMPGIQNGLIYVRVAGGPGASLPGPYLLRVAQTAPKGTIDVFYPQDSNALTADGHVPASIQVFVDPPIPFTLFFDTAASLTPNPLVFAGQKGDAMANLTSTQPGDFTAVVSATSVPSGYVVHTHPPDPPMHHFMPDIQFLRVTTSSEKGVPVNSDVTVTVELLNGQKKPVAAASPVMVNLMMNPGSGMLKPNPLIVMPGQSSNHTSFTAPASAVYKVDAGWAEARSLGPASIMVTAPIGFFAVLVGGLIGGGISCLIVRRPEWQRLIYGAAAATAVWLVSGIGVFASVSAALINNSFSAGVLGVIAGLGGTHVLTAILKSLLGVDVPEAAEAKPAEVAKPATAPESKP